MTSQFTWGSLWRSAGYLSTCSSVGLDCTSRNKQFHYNQQFSDSLALSFSSIINNIIIIIIMYV